MKKSNSGDSFSNIREEIEQAMRGGNIAHARSLLRFVRAKRIPDSSRQIFAEYCRRANLPLLGLRALHPIVRPEGRKISTATPQEKAEYAASLVRLGAANEALVLLDELNPGELPIINLYRAFALFAQWNYRDAIPLLERYVSTPGLEHYQRAVARGNLAAALTYERRTGAEQLIEDGLREAKEKSYSLVHASLLSTRIELAIARTDWKGADRAISNASPLLHRDALEALFLRKWKAVLEIYRGKATKKSLSALELVREEARRLQHWETLRSCDYHQAVATRDESILLRVYFGTPFETLRERLLTEFGRPVSIPETYLWKFDESAARPTVLDPLGLGSKPKMKPGELMFRLLRTLASDLYRPQRSTLIHSRLYPGEHFNPYSSPTRIHQGIKSLRQWLARKLPRLKIDQSNGAYRLHGGAGIALLISADGSSRARIDERLVQLSNYFSSASEPFTAREVGKRLKLGHATAIRLLRDGVSKGTIHRLGGGRSARYALAAPRRPPRGPKS